MSQPNIKELLEKAKTSQAQPDPEAAKKFYERIAAGVQKMKQKLAEKKAEQNKEDKNV